MKASELPAEDYGTAIARESVRITRLLPGPIERVWSYLTQEDKRRQWMAAGAIELAPGGTVRHVFDNSRLTERDDRPPPKYAGYAGEVTSVGHVIACEAPTLLSYSWNEESGTPSEVRFDLEPQGDKVLLTVTHSRISSRGAMMSFSAGWHTHLDILRDRLEGREPPVFWPKHTRLEAEYEQRIPDF